jgi:hypothetical protein
MYIKVSKIIPGGGGGLLVLSFIFMAMDGVVMGCLCGYEQNCFWKGILVRVRVGGIF